MPAVHFKVLWPDGELIQYYSPSTIIRSHLDTDIRYSQQRFAESAFNALNEASERVREKYGFACSAAADEAKKIKLKLNQLAENQVNGDVVVTQFE